MEGLGLLIIAGFLFLVALSGIVTGGFFALRERMVHKKAEAGRLACSVDTD